MYIIISINTYYIIILHVYYYYYYYTSVMSLPSRPGPLKTKAEAETQTNN